MMKKRLFAMILASAMALSLTACGGGNSSTSGGSSSQTGISNLPHDSSSDGTLTLNKTEVTLNKAGATFKLNWTVEPAVESDPTFSSSDESVATIDENGTITAVAPGSATVTVECGGATATCNVTCDWTEDDSQSGGDTSQPNGSSDPSSSVDLSAFYTATTGKHEFGFLKLADSGILDTLYEGLTGISTEQCQVYYCEMSMNNGEFGLVQVKDSKDVDAVKKIFQARIDYMVGDGNGPGGAQYPMAMDSWENNSRIVSNGNYVMMVVHENCDDIVNDFNALF